jgi:hypothetical protein
VIAEAQISVIAARIITAAWVIKPKPRRSSRSSWNPRRSSVKVALGIF